MAAKQNYTPEMVAQAVEMYQELGNEGIEQIAESLGRNVRSVRSKLVREGVYVAAEKPTRSAVDKGPTKKEMLRELSELVDFPTAGFDGATKEAIGYLLEAFAVQPEEELETEDEPEVE